MSTPAVAYSSRYSLATGGDAVRRLRLLHRVYSPVGRQVLRKAGLSRGMKVADLGCGPGMMTRALASLVGPFGSVTAVDLHAAQLEQARRLCAQESLRNVAFVEADATRTGLPRNSFDLVYCRFLLLHLRNPAACLQEMWEILKPGGIVVIEDGDLATARSVPATALDSFADLFSRLAEIRGVDYSIENRLSQLVSAAGFSEIGLKVHQPAHRAGSMGLLLKWSVEEAAPAFVESGLMTPDELTLTLSEMQSAAEDPGVLAIGPRVSVVWGRKRAA